LYFIYSIRDYYSIWPSNPNTTSIVTVFIVNDFLCSTVPFTLSTVYHTFMPHHSGPHTYQWLLKTDILGVWFVCTFGPLSSIYNGLYCTPMLLTLYLMIYSTLSAYVLFYLMFVDCKQKRAGALTAQFVMRVLMLPIRLSSISQASVSAVRYYSVVECISAVGALVNAFHVPERWLPGRLDYIANGHNLMHVAAVLCVLIGRQAFLCDMQWLNEVGTCV